MSTDPAPAQVFYINEHSPEWRRIKEHCESQIEMHQRYLESIGLPYQETEGHRFALAELRAILKLPKTSMIGPNLKDE